jgi:hypothetical protein
MTPKPSCKGENETPIRSRVAAVAEGVRMESVRTPESGVSARFRGIRTGMARRRRMFATIALGVGIGAVVPYVLDRALASRTNETPHAAPAWTTTLPVRRPVPPTPTRPIAAAPASAASPSVGFLGMDERAVRESLRNRPLASVVKGGGGRSLGFKVTLDDGTVGYFKPEQTFSAAHWYSEVAAYYLDRALGFGRTPPVVGRRFDWATLRARAGADSRVAEVRPSPDGSVRGTFSWWVPGGLEPIRLGRAWERVVRIEGPLGRTPYDRPALVREGAGGNDGPMRDIPASRIVELSDMLIFDYLVQNVDRWGGDFVNVRARANGGPLVFLDNGAGFWPNEQRLPLMESRLRPLQKFSRRTVAALRAFDLEAYRRALESDALAPILTERMIVGLGDRVRAVVAHVDSMYARFGEAVWLP